MYYIYIYILLDNNIIGHFDGAEIVHFTFNTMTDFNDIEGLLDDIVLTTDSE